VGSVLEYAAVQQFGAKKGAFGRTRRGAPIPWGDIPPRPFLGLSDADRRSILDLIAEHLDEGLNERRAAGSQGSIGAGLGLESGQRAH